MKILVVTQFFHPENFRINDLIEELDNRDNEVTILTGLPNYPGGNIYKGFSYSSLGKSYKGRIKIIRAPILPRFSSTKIQLTLNYLSFVLCASIIGLFYCRQKYDLIFTYAPSPVTVALPAIFLNLFKRIPHIIWIQDLWPEVFMAVEAPKAKIFYSTVKSMMKFIYKKSSLILVQSKEFKIPITNLGINEDKIKYFPNWAENFFIPVDKEIAQAKVSHIPGNESFKIMFAGNIGAAQSFDIILDAAIKLKEENISWIILGDGRKKKWLDDQIKLHSMENSIFTLGSKPVTDMPYYYSLADAMLVSLKPHPIFSAWIPGKIQSYLACGKPIIGLLEGAGASIIKESKSGVTIESGDSRELADKVKNLSKKSNSELLIMGENALKYYNEKFNRDKLITELESHLKEILP